MAYASLPFEIVQLARLLGNPGFWIRLLGVDRLRILLDSACLTRFAQTWVTEKAHLAIQREQHPKVRDSLKQLLAQLESSSQHLNDHESMVIFARPTLFKGIKHATHKLR